MIDPQKIHRLARWLHLRRVRLLPGLLQRWNYFLTGCDLPGSVRIGRGVRFQHHGAGVIVHPRTVIGDDVMIHPQVVIGQNVRHREPVDLDEIVIGEGAQLGAGAKIIASGRLEIGARADVGANAVVLGWSAPPAEGRASGGQRLQSRFAGPPDDRLLPEIGGEERPGALAPLEGRLRVGDHAHDLPGRLLRIDERARAE